MHLSVDIATSRRWGGELFVYSLKVSSLDIAFCQAEPLDRLQKEARVACGRMWSHVGFWSCKHLRICKPNEREVKAPPYTDQSTARNAENHVTLRPQSKPRGWQNKFAQAVQMHRHRRDPWFWQNDTDFRAIAEILNWEAKLQTAVVHARGMQGHGSLRKIEQRCIRTNSSMNIRTTGATRASAFRQFLSPHPLDMHTVHPQQH